MGLAIDLARLSAPVQKILDPRGPAPLRQMAARGIAPGLRPHEAVTVVVLLAESGDAQLADVAKATLAKLPGPVLNGALTADLPGPVLGRIAPLYAANREIMERVFALPQLSEEAVAELAAVANEELTELIATNEQRLLACPAIIEKLYMNKATRMSTADRLIELAVRNGVEVTGIPAFAEAAAAIAGKTADVKEKPPEIADQLFKEVEAIGEELDALLKVEDTHVVDKETGEEKVKEKVLPLHARIAEMSISQKIRCAMLGSAGARAILVRDSNRLVAEAVIKSPMLQENEVDRISQSRNVSDAVLRGIARSPAWAKSYAIKLNLVMNPRTPLAISSGFLSHMREGDLKAIVKSKNVSGAIASAAKQVLARKAK